MSEDKLMWVAPDVTGAQVHAWMKSAGVSHKDMADAMGTSVCTLNNMLYTHRNKIVPSRYRMCIAAAAIFSGYRGLFNIKLVEVSVAISLARGFRAAQIPKNKRTLADAKTIGYASQLSDILLRTVVEVEAMPKHGKDPKVQTHDEGSKEDASSSPETAASS